MNIYVAHSTAFNFKEELYTPLRESELSRVHTVVLPHEQSSEQFNSKEYLKTCDVVIAEVSYPSTGEGIELGWANLYGVSIIGIYKEGTKPSGALKAVTDTLIEYTDAADMIEKLCLRYLQH